MNIKIKKLTLDNFKCFKHKEFSFNDDVTTIRGRNGVGKTTIADAILWCLFGKNSQGQSDFDLKTHDENGKPIPNLDHSVEMVLNCDAGYITLKRTLKETWIKKRGSEEQVFKNNTTEYMVNGEVMTAGDYKKYIASLVSEDVFKCITNPSYFPSLEWQEQRQFLTALAGSIEPEYIADTDDLVELVHQLDNSSDDITSYRKHLSYQIKQIKDKLEKIPVRLEEQNKALPESLDYDSIQKELEQAQKGLEEVNQKIVAIKSGNGGDVLRNQIRTELKELQASIDKVEEVERKAYRLRQQDHDNTVSELIHKFNELLNNQKGFEQAIPSFDRMIERCKETLAQCEKEAQVIREEWAYNLARKITWSDEDNMCPTCGQYLPDEIVAEKRKKAVENLNKSKAETKEKLTKMAEDVKSLRAETESQIATFNQNKADAEHKLAETKEQINQVFAEKQKAEKEPVLTIEQALAECKGYQELLQSRDELRKKLDSVGIDEEDITKLQNIEFAKAEYEAQIDGLKSQLATRDMRLKILALIDGIEEERKDLVRHLSELEKKEDVAASYQARQNQILEERINKHFSLVQWKMFRTVNNGGDPFDEPYCECYVDGVAYHDGLNQAARLNAGLDICNALCKHYNVSVPIIIDQSESTLNILQTEGQQLRLEVYNSDLQVI